MHGINDLLQALKGEPVSSVFSTEGTVISASAAPHCGVIKITLALTSEPQDRDVAIGYASPLTLRKEGQLTLNASVALIG